MNVLEIDESINDIQKALGYKVQNVEFYDKTLVLRLWHNHQSFLLVLSVQFGQQGIFLISDEGQLKFKGAQKPILLFGRKHLKSSLFTDVSRDQQVGRKVDFLFTGPNQEDVSIEICLIPSALNISIRAVGKAVHLNKHKALPELKGFEGQAIRARSLEVLKQSWQKGFKPELKEKGKPKKTSITATLEKKKKALVKVENDFAEKLNDHFFEFAELLSTNPDLAKLRFPQFFDTRKNVHKLKDEYFEKHKALVAKRERSLARIKSLQNEIRTLEETSDHDWQKAQRVQPSVQFKQDTKIKTRKLEVAPDLIAYYGKSAVDNLKLLRSAKAWHLWFHVKDVPSSHMILFKDKSRVVQDSEIKQASLWFLSEINSNGRGQGDAVNELIVTECRYVKPIKGDKLGRVNYSNERVYRFRL